MTIDLNKLFNPNNDLDTRSTNALLKAIGDGHSSDFDYLKFKQSIQSLSAMNMDASAAYKAAFATASTMGLTKDRLIKSANKYLGILSNESVSFSDALKSQIDANVNSRESMISQLEARIAENKSKIKELEQQISLFQQKIDNVDSDIEQAQLKINTARDKFKKSFETINNTIKQDIEHINLYL